MSILKKSLILMLVTLIAIPLQAAKPTVTLWDLTVEQNESLSARMSLYIINELKNKNRIDFTENRFKAKSVEVKKRVFDKSLFSEVTEIQKTLEDYKKSEEIALASESAQQLIDLYTENFDNLESFQPLFEAYLQHSFLMNIDGFDDESKESMLQAITIGRNLTFDTKKFSPQFVTRYTRERGRFEKKENSSIEIKGDSVEVYIDGIFFGNSPVKVTDISLGKHFIVLVKDGDVVKKDIIDLKKDGKSITFTKNKEDINIDSLSSEEIFQIAYQLISKKEINTQLQSALNSFAKKENKEFIVFGYTDRKSDLYNASIFLYHRDKNQIAFLSKAEFDSDLLTGDVEGLRVGNETVAGVDNFGKLKIVSITEKENSSLKEIQYPPFKNINFNAQQTTITKNESDDSNRVVAVKKEPIKNNEVKPQKTENNKVKKEKKEDIKLDNADYNLLQNKKSLSVLDKNSNKYNKKEDKSEAFYQTWWFWTISGILLTGAGVGIYFVATDSGDEVKSNVSATW
ncbi:PEGA domain-containing protein [bacterium]|nr:PEGA domain-containing protein [bacterium]